MFEHSAVGGLRAEADGVELSILAGGVLRADRVVLATNVFPALLKRNRLMTVPVYDYVLMTEPLSTEQLAAIGWNDRQGLSDLANQFHYYRLSADNRILFGGYDAVYHYGRAVRPAYENRPTSYETLASHFFTTFPQLDGLRFSHKWAGAIDTSTQFCAFYGTAREGQIAYAAGFTGLGVAGHRASPAKSCWTFSRAPTPNGRASTWCKSAPCRSRPSRQPRSASTRRAGRSTAPTTARVAAIFSFARSTQ